jgi:hypothetical protein
LFHAPSCTEPAIAQVNVSRTARAPCKPRHVVIVQGFEGDFAKLAPQLFLICGNETDATSLEPPEKTAIMVDLAAVPVSLAGLLRHAFGPMTA